MIHCACEEAGVEETIMDTLSNVNAPAKGGFTPASIPSTKDARVTLDIAPTPPLQWFVFRATYGREGDIHFIRFTMACTVYIRLKLIDFDSF